MGTTFGCVQRLAVSYFASKRASYIIQASLHLKLMQSVIEAKTDASKRFFLSVGITTNFVKATKAFVQLESLLTRQESFSWLFLHPPRITADHLEGIANLPNYVCSFSVFSYSHQSFLQNISVDSTFCSIVTCSVHCKLGALSGNG